ncbi:hypothetical protein M409DRAFT_30365 [Zasmidium cellare ATCC 36951]|uniref:Zn(2)-C6 fungal-type domain-containing protein n=1 Tax=Zasmidium cellare ATCC 36951 TaxID=1080233 RepID=A0A6A6C0J7_ZASCE|nr:uncharacterized protein M409DRAFT_30365 [Zasmidium cellare ATCC 36951]KAF2159226.1 hypothetical protein M409DRAFT_30365 [Zasmidium cellare ATCC 36951]
MVKVRGCDSCRSSRVKCDNQRPICGRCSRLQRPCTGYRDPTDLIIVQDETQSGRASSAQERSPRSATIADRESVSRSRYVPPQHYTACQKLPWMRSDLANEPRPRLHDIAVSRFFAHYVLYPNRHVGDDGYLPDLPYFYSRSSDGSTLQSAVRACALASFANASRQCELSVRACRAYGRALETLKGNILDTAVMKRDDTLMSVLVLDFYAVLTDKTPAFLGPHSTAIAAILQARGNQQIRTTVGWNLFRVAHRRVQHRKMFMRALSQPIETLSWFEDTAPSHIEARLGYNGCRIINACQRAKDILASEDPTSDLVNMIEELHTIAIETSAWTDLLPESWLPWTSSDMPHDPESTLPDDLIPRTNIQYSDIWIANTWNCHRTYQVHLHETLFECYSALPSTTPPSSAQDKIRDAVRRLTNDMLDSIPLLLGVNGEMQYHPELGSYYAFGVIDYVGKSVLAGEEQREMARRLGGRILEGWKGRGEVR